MKVLLACALALISFQVLEAKVFDASQFQHKIRTTANSSHAHKRYSSHQQHATTVDMRAVCGKSNPPAASRIIGSWEAGVHEFPWMVALWVDQTLICSGSLISDQWILTAARCAQDVPSYRILLGAHNVLDVEDFRVEVRVVTDAENTIIHPGWNVNSLHADIALIKLPTPVELSDIIRPICLPAANEADQHVGEVEIVSGWGRPSADNVAFISSKLRKTNVTVISNAACSQVYDGITDDHICVSTQDGHATCAGDTGGPLSHVSEDGTFTQIGVVSITQPVGCIAGNPSGFSRVSNYIQWISAVTGLEV